MASVRRISRARNSHVCLRASMIQDETARCHGPRRRCSMISRRSALTQLMGSGLAVTMLVAMTACGGPPTWVQKGSAAYNGKDPKAFYGVGSIVGIKNEPLAWEEHTSELQSHSDLVCRLLLE